VGPERNRRRRRRRRPSFCSFSVARRAPTQPKHAKTPKTPNSTQPSRVKGDPGAGIVCVTPDSLLPRGWCPGAQALVAVGRADGRADVVAVPSGRVLASARAPTQAAAAAAAAQAPRPQRDVKHEQLADDPRRVVAVAFFLPPGGGGSAGAEGVGKGGGGGGSSSSGRGDGDGNGNGGGKKKKKSKKEGVADADAPPVWPHLLVLHGTGLACVYRLGPEVLQQPQQQQQQQQQAAADGDGGEQGKDGAAAAAAAAVAAARPLLTPNTTFQASLNARCAALDPRSIAAVRAWRLPGVLAGGQDEDGGDRGGNQAPPPPPPPRAPLLAVGAEGTALSLYDLGAGRRVWQAKSPKPDRTGLAERPHHTAVAFLPGVPGQAEGGSAATGGQGAEGGGKGGGGTDAEPPIPRFVMLVGTATHKVHAYDTAIGKRPQASAEWGTARITAIVPQRQQRRAGQEPAAAAAAAAAAAVGAAADGAGVGADFWVADGVGRAGSLELRGIGGGAKGPDGAGGMQLLTPKGGAGAQALLRGAAGSVRAVAALSLSPAPAPAAASSASSAAASRRGGSREVVAVAGLDRHLRIYDARTHACVGRVYAKQQLTGAVWVPPLLLTGAARAMLPPPPPRAPAAAAAARANGGAGGGGGSKRAAGEEVEYDREAGRANERGMRATAKEAAPKKKSKL